MKYGKAEIKRCGNWAFICRYWETSRSWGHEVSLCKDGTEVAMVRVRYYNRTWERYTFQTAMQCAVEKYKREKLEKYLDDVRSDYGKARGSRRFRKGEKQFYVDMFNRVWATNGYENGLLLEEFVEGGKDY